MMSNTKVEKLALALVAVMVILQGVNVVRVFTDPIGFSEYMGLPVSDAGSAGFVYVYGLRTLFIVFLVGALLYLRAIRPLFIVACAALVMPVGDAVLAADAGASASIITRHVVIGIYILGTAYVLWKARNADPKTDR